MHSITSTFLIGTTSSGEVYCISLSLMSNTNLPPEKSFPVLVRIEMPFKVIPLNLFIAMQKLTFLFSYWITLSSLHALDLNKLISKYLSLPIAFLFECIESSSGMIICANAQYTVHMVPLDELVKFILAKEESIIGMYLFVQFLHPFVQFFRTSVISLTSSLLTSLSFFPL